MPPDMTLALWPQNEALRARYLVNKAARAVSSLKRTSWHVCILALRGPLLLAGSLHIGLGTPATHVRVASTLFQAAHTS